VLSWILDLQKKFKAEGKPVNHDTITEFAWETLKSGKVSMEPQIYLKKLFVKFGTLNDAPVYHIFPKPIQFMVIGCLTVV
jgi:hypothetical protein